MRRFYYISDDLDNLEQIEHELESGGIARPQIYLLSNDDVGLENHDVNRVASFLKTDVVHLGEIGAVLGLAIAALILLVAHYSGIAAEVSWVPFIFLAIIGFGFATWEAGFIGLHARHGRSDTNQSSQYCRELTYWSAGHKWTEKGHNSDNRLRSQKSFLIK